jgi:hypothetical protein
MAGPNVGEKDTGATDETGAIAAGEEVTGASEEITGASVKGVSGGIVTGGTVDGTLVAGAPVGVVVCSTGGGDDTETEGSAVG